MPRFSRNDGPNYPDRRPKPRPSGYAPQRYSPSSPPPQNRDNRDNRDFRDRPNFRPPPPKSRRPSGPAILEPRQPASGKQRRRMLKAAAWRLAQILHVRPADVVKTLATQPTLERAFPGAPIQDRRGEAYRLAAKVWRLSRR